MDPNRSEPWSISIALLLFFVADQDSYVILRNRLYRWFDPDRKWAIYIMYREIDPQ
jgi:hypothetical protein